MRIFSIILIVFFRVATYATDYGDKSCTIFVMDALKVVKDGGANNHLSLTVAMKKDVFTRDFKKYQVKLVEFPNAKVTWLDDRATHMLFHFENFAPGVISKYSQIKVTAFITNGIDSLFDYNDNVILTKQNDWQYRNPNCL